MTEKFEELNLPNAVITRIIKEAIPPGSIVSKECILTFKISIKKLINQVQPSNGKYSNGVTVTLMGSQGWLEYFDQADLTN